MYLCLCVYFPVRVHVGSWRHSKPPELRRLTSNPAAAQLGASPDMQVRHRLHAPDSHVGTAAQQCTGFGKLALAFELYAQACLLAFHDDAVQLAWACERA